MRKSRFNLQTGTRKQTEKNCIYTYRSVLDCKEAESIQRTEWTSHPSPSVRLTQPRELTSHHHPGSRRPSYCPLRPFSTSPSGQLKTVSEGSDWTVPPLTDGRSGAVAHFRLQDSDWLPRYTNAHSYTNTNTHKAPQPLLPLPRVRFRLRPGSVWRHAYI